jgi:hypothetical protein
MSKEAVQTVISKAVSDDKFREALFANPDKALDGYDLTEDEIAALKHIDAESMQSLTGSLDERISKAFIIGWSVGSGGGWRKARSRRSRTPGWRLGGPKP